LASRHCGRKLKDKGCLGWSIGEVLTPPRQRSPGVFLHRLGLVLHRSQHLGAQICEFNRGRRLQGQLHPHWSHEHTGDDLPERSTWLDYACGPDLEIASRSVNEMQSVVEMRPNERIIRSG